MDRHSRKYIYFVSDLHLGVDFDRSSKDREAIFIAWLNEISNTAKALYLVGDIFDFWFEYKYVVPKGYVRLLAKLAAMVETGVDIHYFKGNHDMWIYTYFQEELGLQVHDYSVNHQLLGRKFYVTHGDGLGAGDFFYKIIKSILRNRIAQSFFSFLHPSIGLPLMKIMSRHSRKKELRTESGENQENIIEYAENLSQKVILDYFICGHRHYPTIRLLSNDKTTYCNLGDWISHFSYAVWDGQNFELKKYNLPKPS